MEPGSSVDGIIIGGERGERKGVGTFDESCGYGVEGEIRTRNVSGSCNRLHPPGRVGGPWSGL